ncbi:MAG TPA: vitamin-B12 independent methionine synthase [Candidatus Binatia bacterium]|nr:vitamin-B12 independent methionine synthase [Candidatus Binatia bacterium]
MNAQRLLLEYDDGRSGSFEALKDVPEDKFVVLGLVTTKRARLENMEELKQKVSEAGRYVPLERLGISPQCGFASSIIGNNISFDDQRYKLRLVVDIAQQIWG